MSSSSSSSSTLRHSCDRCRQHKVRCYKANGEIQTIVDDASTCERCLKADVPCVYSSKQRKRRTGSHHHRRQQQQNSLPFGQDGIWSSGISNDGLDLNMPMLDLTDINLTTGFDDNDLFGWGSNDANTSPSTSIAHRPKTAETYSTETQDSSGSREEAEASNEDSAINQITTISIRACRATRQLQQQGHSASPLMVNSFEVNEAFETANNLISVVNTISSDAQDVGMMFMAIASHQHVFALFRTICTSIQDFIGRDKENQPDGAAFAQFVMVLQLVMHLVNRLERSLKMGTAKSAVDQGALPTPEEDGREGSYFSVVEGGNLVATAKGVLEKLPGEHDRLRKIIGDLQNTMEERLNA